MTEVALVKMPDLEGKRLSFALAEDRVAHHPEFRDFFVRTVNLDRKGLAEPGFVRAPSGIVYAFIFIGRSGLPFRRALKFTRWSMHSSQSTAKCWIGIYGRFSDG